jgi:hypothetical protein
MDALRGTALAYGAAIAVHTADHLRRGLDASPHAVIALGYAALAAQVLVIGAALAGHRLAPVAALAFGAADALGVVAVHLVPRWSGLSDPFPGAVPGANVTALSWVTAVVEVLAALAFAYAGWRRSFGARAGAAAA